MSKKVKTFFKIIYYVFTFGLGIVLAFLMPGMKQYQELAITMERSLQTGDYDKAMSLIGGFYDDREVFQTKFDDESGIVIYSAATLTFNEKEKRYYMNPTYSGFLFNARGYAVKGDEANETKLLVEDKNGNEVKIELLNYDSNKDKTNDMISTLDSSTYVYFEVLLGKIEDIHKLSFIDREGKTFKSVSPNLNYSESLFTDVKDFVGLFDECQKKLTNKNITSEQKERIEKAIENGQKEFLQKQPDFYKIGNHNDVIKKANVDATVFILFYFIWIYILGDFLVGHRYIWHGMVWCYNKSKRAIENHKRKKMGMEPIKEEEGPSENLNTLLKMRLIVPEGCKTNVSINYHNEHAEINLVLTKDNNYTQSLVVAQGSYVNAWLECPGYHTVNLPKTLVVKGYRMTVEVTLEKSDKNLENDEQIIDNKLEVKDENRN